MEKRFKEIISIQTIIDTETNKEYKYSMVNDDLLTLINNIAEENTILKSENAHYKLMLMSLEKASKNLIENTLRKWD